MQTAGEEANQSSKEPLPPHWEMRIDERTGWPYFLNHFDKSTTWEDPRLGMRRPAAPGARTHHPQQQENTGSVEIPVHVQQHGEKLNQGGAAFDDYSFGPSTRPHGMNPRLHQQGFQTAFPNHHQNNNGSRSFDTSLPGFGPHSNPLVPPSVTRRSTSPRPVKTTTATPTSLHSASSNNSSASGGSGTISFNRTGDDEETQSNLGSNQSRESVSTSNMSQATSTSDHEQKEVSPPQKTKPVPKTPLDLIAEAHTDAAAYVSDIETFKGAKGSKEYKYIEEMLERCLIRLDNVEANGDDNIRTKRKETVRYIQQCLDQLELKGMANEVSDS